MWLPHPASFWLPSRAVTHGMVNPSVQSISIPPPPPAWQRRPVLLVLMRVLALTLTAAVPEGRRSYSPQVAWTRKKLRNRRRS